MVGGGSPLVFSQKRQIVTSSGWIPLQLVLIPSSVQFQIVELPAEETVSDGRRALIHAARVGEVQRAVGDVSVLIPAGRVARVSRTEPERIRAQEAPLA